VCDGQDNDCNGLDDAGNPGVGGWETDGDADLQAECEGDCDDADPENFSGNPEVCDGQDNNCGFDVDEETVVGDGAGCSDGLFCNGIESCFEAECVTAPTDCDDGDDCTADACSEDLDSCVNTPTDLGPPTFGGDLLLTPVSDTEIRVRWLGASDDVSTDEAIVYNVYMGSDPSSVDTSTPASTVFGTLSTTVAGLVPLSSPGFAVEAVDECGYTSGPGDVYSIGTPGWELVGASLSSTAISPDVAIGPGEIGYVSYGEIGPSNTTVEVQAFDGADWDFVGSSLNVDPSATASVPRIAAGDSAELAVSWNEGGLHVADWNGVSWDLLPDVGVTPNYGSPMEWWDGDLYLVYDQSHDIRGQVFDGVSWSSLGYLSTGYASYWPDLARGPTGPVAAYSQYEPTCSAPYCSYGYRAHYRRWTGSSWNGGYLGSGSNAYWPSAAGFGDDYLAAYAYYGIIETRSTVDGPWDDEASFEAGIGTMSYPALSSRGRYACLSYSDGAADVYASARDASGWRTLGTEAIGDGFARSDAWGRNCWLVMAPGTGGLLEVHRWLDERWVIIDGDADFSDTLDVDVDLYHPEGVSMRLDTDPLFSSAGWEAYTDQTTYTFPVGDGIQALYVEVVDLAGDSWFYEDSIIVDTTPPATPTLTQVVPGLSSLNVAWDNATNAAGYELYYDTDAGPPYTSSAAAQGPSPLDFTSDESSAILQGLPAGETWHLALSAYNANGDSALTSDSPHRLATRPEPTDVWHSANGVDSSGVLHVVYSRYAAEDLRHAWLDGNTWQFETISTWRRPYKVDMVIDEDDELHVAWYDWQSEDLWYAHHDGVTWTTDEVVSSGDVGLDLSINVSPDGVPWIAYRDNTNDDLELARQDGPGWTLTVLDSTGNSGRGPKLRWSPDGLPKIAYLDQGYMYILTGDPVGDIWSSEFLWRTGWYGVGYDISADGKEHILYRDSVTAADGLYYASRYPDQDWQVVLVEARGDYSPFLVADDSGGAYLGARWNIGCYFWHADPNGVISDQLLSSAGGFGLSTDGTLAYISDGRYSSPFTVYPDVLAQ